MTPVEVSHDVQIAYLDGVRNSKKGVGTSYCDGLAAAAPLIVADELERLAHEVDSTGTPDDDAVTTGFKNGQRWFKHYLRQRAIELRGES